MVLLSRRWQDQGVGWAPTTGQAAGGAGLWALASSLVFSVVNPSQTSATFRRNLEVMKLLPVAWRKAACHRDHHRGFSLIFSLSLTAADLMRGVRNRDTWGLGVGSLPSDSCSESEVGVWRTLPGRTIDHACGGRESPGRSLSHSHAGLCTLKNYRIVEKFRQTVQWSWEHLFWGCSRETELKFVPCSLVGSIWSRSVPSTELGHTILVLGSSHRIVTSQQKGQH